MSNPHNYQKDKQEEETLHHLADFVSPDYASFFKPHLARDASNDFDFYSADKSICLEVTVVTREGQRRLNAFCNATRNPNRIRDKAIKDGVFLQTETVQGGDMVFARDPFLGIVPAIISSIKEKETKRIGKTNRSPARQYQLALVVNGTDLVDKHWQRIEKSLQNEFASTGFTKMFLITCYSIYVFDKSNPIRIVQKHPFLQ